MNWADNKGAFIVPDVPSPKPMTFAESIKHCFRNYAVFRGRASRSEYWYFQLLYPIIVLLGSLSGLLGSVIGGQMAGDIVGLPFFSLFLAWIIPSLAVGVRRLHDTGHSGAWVWLGLIPIVGAIVILVWTCRAGDKVPNRFGPP
jgi:uncharacterized membrane protein YhaH (DUF805 family)